MPEAEPESHDVDPRHVSDIG